MGAEKFKQQRKQKVKENRTKRREEEMVKWGRTSPNSSDKAYVEGNVRKVADNRAYGHRKAISEGQEGNLFADSIRRTKEVKREFGTTQKKQKYNIMSSANPNGTKFTDHLNSTKLDGLSTAKANQRTGQPLRNIGQYVAGALKDTVIDIPVDMMKGADYAMGQITGGISGALEQSGNVFKSIAEGKNHIDKGLIKRNIEASRQESDKTGWGKGFGDYLQEVGRRSDADYGIKRTEKEQQKADLIAGITGLGMDILNPITIEGALKPLTKGVTKSFDEMVKGTADLSTGFVPKELTNIKGKYNNTLKKATGASDDVFYSGKTNLDVNNTEIDRMLNKGFDNAINKSEKVIKTGKTKLDGFLNQLKQRRPGNVEEPGMFPYNISKIDMNSKTKLSEGKLQALELDKNIEMSKIDKALDSFGDDYEKIDAFMDNLERMNPKLYNEYNGISDRVDELARIGETKQLLNDNYTKAVKERSGDNVKTRRSVEVNPNGFKDTTPIAPRKPLGENVAGFTNYTKHYIDQKLPKASYEQRVQAIDSLKNLSRKITKSNQDKTIQALNKTLFDGKNVIRNNVPKHDLRQFTNYMQDAIEYQNALDNGVAKIKIHNKDGKLVNFDVFDKKGNVNKLENKINLFARNMVDDLFEDKKSIKANAVGVKYKSEITKPRELLEKKKKTTTLTPGEEKQLKDLKMREDLWDKIHADTRDMEFDEFNEYVSKNFPNLSSEQQYKNITDELASEHKITSDVDKLDYEEKQMSKIKYKKTVDRIRNEAGIKYVEYNNVKVDPKLKQTNKMVNGTKWTRDSLDNIQKYISQELNLTSQGRLEDAKIAREEMQKIVRKLREKGVDDNAYFEQIKQFKLNAMQDMQVAYTKQSNLPIKEANKLPTALDKFGIKLNGKELVTQKLGGLNADELQAKYIMSQGAKSLDELFEITDPKVIQRGDNIGEEISSLLRPNKTDKTPTSRSGLDSEYADVHNKVKNTTNVDDVDIPWNVDPETGELLDEVATTSDDIFNGKYNADQISLDDAKTNEEAVIKALKKNGIDPTQQPPKEKPKNMPVKLYKAWLNTWKKGVTIYNPGWHLQNFFQNKGQNYLALGNKAFAPQTEARNLLKELQGGQELSSLAIKAKELNVLGEIGEDFTSNSKGLMSKIDNSKMMNKLGESEQTARLHHWLAQINNGMSPEQAKKSVDKYLFDYSDKNDKKYDKVMKNIDPFWTFHKNNARLMVESGLKHPTRMGNIRRGVDGLDNSIAEEDRQNEESSYGRTQIPGATYHDDVSNADYNYMYKQQMFPEFEDGIPTSEDDIENKMNPLLRIAMQTAKGEGNFGNKITTNEEAKWGETTIPERFKEIAMELNPVVPTLVNTIDKVNSRNKKVDEDKMGTEITNKQILNDWLKWAFGNKGNWYRNM